MDDAEVDEQNRFDAHERELTTARQAQIQAETRVLALESLVERLERQRDHADSLLLNLTAAAQEYLMPLRHPAYVNARTHLCKVSTRDKYERRLGD